ncbi:hypothetical protein MMP66_18395 [Acinetobacter dispersus]|uniref:hypothetical protein n=1 Tax=Acinetobacter dispersus TaxID=70348 RepID=UPI0002D0262D|nr:hypothetical protein [Acinetobacter dispersus]ENX54020.1 hypothetical protein F901_01304 [Acinetobacter dispersus]MCH7396222.1 hypothetical protein [Acinetobacter dispersus]
MSTALLLNDTSLNNVVYKSMQEFGEDFIEKLPKNFKNLNISDRQIDKNNKMEPISVHIDNIQLIQEIMLQVLSDPITLHAQKNAEKAFQAFLAKDQTDAGLLKFFNGWNETHKTTSLVSGKIIMRLAADAILIKDLELKNYLITMANMHEVAKDDFGLGHKGHDGMYVYMTSAFNASAWLENQYRVKECNDFSKFLYDVGISNYKAPLNSSEYNYSILEAMMVSVSSELWNGREYNYLAQFIESKLSSFKPDLRNNLIEFRNAKGYVLGHAGEIENRHGLHAFVAATVFAKSRNILFDFKKLKETMLNYNYRVGLAFEALHKALTAS